MTKINDITVFLLWIIKDYISNDQTTNTKSWHREEHRIIESAIIDNVGMSKSKSSLSKISFVEFNSYSGISRWHWPPEPDFSDLRVELKFRFDRGRRFFPTSADINHTSISVFRTPASHVATSSRENISFMDGCRTISLSLVLCFCFGAYTEPDDNGIVPDKHDQSSNYIAELILIF